MNLVTIEEIANELGITPQRVREYCRMGYMGTLWQRRWVITRKEFEDFKKNDYTGQPGRPPKKPP
jgi:predicted transcriptional regulator